MNTYTILRLLLFMHLTGIVFFIGMTITDFLLMQQVFGTLKNDFDRSVSLLFFSKKIQRLTGIGIAVTLISAFGMMWVTRGVFGEQFWLRLKFPLVVFAILNVIFIGRRQGIKLRKMLEVGEHDSPGLIRHRRNLKLFYLIQFMLFICIIILSVFKFN